MELRYTSHLMGLCTMVRLINDYRWHDCGVTATLPTSIEQRLSLSRNVSPMLA
jgi:hypothetical protein